MLDHVLLVLRVSVVRHAIHLPEREVVLLLVHAVVVAGQVAVMGQGLAGRPGQAEQEKRRAWGRSRSWGWTRD